MKITQVKLGTISVPLRVPFKTALRTVDAVNDVIVEILTDTGEKGYGEAPPTGVITGDTTGAIVGAIRDHIAPKLIGLDIDCFEDVIRTVQSAVVHNTSAKAAVDMALYDLYGQLYRIPVYKLLGGARKTITTDITISVNSPEEMERDGEDVRQIKQDILTLARKLCADTAAREKAPLLYKAVFSVGEDADMAWFTAILEELQTALLS